MAYMYSIASFKVVTGIGPLKLLKLRSLQDRNKSHMSINYIFLPTNYII